ncbi:THO complex subunit 2 [Coccomyxa sp. Obi]|nr:THO complex subunit 2 [Coccomyxa sp. Obi]
MSGMTVGGGSPSVSQPGSLATPQVIEGLNEGKVLASEIGATVTGIDSANFRQYLLELAHAVAAGQLLPAKYAVGMKASGIPVGDGTPLLLAEVLWAVWVEVQGAGNAAAAQTLIADLAKELLKEHLVTKDVLMMNMDGAFLEEVGAVTKAENLRKKEIQLNTRMHYTQRRFNLLREESEGFAKLITALCASTKNTPVDHLVTEVKALIGFFDLDPNRVYDVILDAFEADPKNAALLHLAPLFSPEARTQILGFRFQRLAAAKAAAPEALFNIAAQLIKAKLVPLEGLLPHLAPPDKEAQAAVQEARKKLAEAVDKIGVISLTQAAAEKDEASRSKVGLAAGKMELDARVYVADILGPALAANHKLGLAAGLLKVDDWESASKLLNLLDSLKLDLMAFPPIARELCKLVRKRLDPSFKALYPDGPRCLCILNRKNGGAEVEIALMEDDTLGLLLRLGAHAHVDLTLLSQLARILRHALVRASVLLSSPPTIAEGNRRVDLVKLLLLEVLLPALCLVPANVGLVNDIWGVLDLIATTDRWLIYNRLKAKEKDDPLLKAAGKLATTEVRKVMRRVHAPDSKDKKERKRLLAPFARLLAKATHANPLPVCALIVSHVEAYPVMTEPILDAMRYLTPYGYDVLSFTLVHQLGASGRDKLKADGLNISDWLQGLSGFVGQACRRYDKMDTSAICQYIANTLKAAQSYDLLVLKALLSDMTGIMLVSDLSSEQVEALAGGPLLQQEVINLGAQTASAKAISRTSNRLVAALRNDKLAMPLFIMLAQQRRFISTSTDSPHLKLIAELYDKCQETLYLYTEFVSNALPAAEWAELLPPVSELVTQYGIDFEVAFHGHRSLLKDMSPPAVALPDLMPAENGDTAMEEVEDGELEEEKLPVGHALPNGVGIKHEHGEIALASEAGPGPGTEIWLRIVEDLRGLHSEDVWKVMSPEFYLTFWSLSYGDIFVPKDRYKREIQKLTDLQNMKKAEERSKKQLLEQARDPRYMYRNDAQVDVSEIEDDLVSIKEQLERLKDVLKAMPEELRAQEANAARVERLLAAARPHWRCERKGMLQAYLQLCILPRVTYSPTDAAFCAKFTQRLHELAVPFFPTILYLDTMMKQLINLVFSCTDREALNLAIFLNETFIMLERWRGNEGVYVRECLPVPGFSVSFTDPDAERTKFGAYRSLCARWQNHVTIGLRAALQSKDYVQIRNALLILNTTVKVFPATHQSARLIKAAVQGVRDTDSSEDDLKTMANMYSVALENEIRKPGRMLSKDEYEGTGEPPKKLEVAQNGGSRPPTAKPGTGGSKAQVKGASAGREEASSSAGKEAAKGSTAAGKHSAGEAGAATDGQRRKELRAEAAEFRPGSGENAAAAAKTTGDAKPPRNGARTGTDAKSGTDARSAADAKSGADAKSARSGSAGGKTEAKGREGRGDAKTDVKRSSDTGRRRDADKADVAKGAEDKSQRPPKRPRTDTAEVLTALWCLCNTIR